MPKEDELDLIHRFKKGDATAFNELVGRYQKDIYLVARRLLNTHEEAEDLSQEVFIKAYRSLRDFRGDSTLFTWLYRIAVNLSLNVLRKRKIRQFFSLETIGLSLTSSSPNADQQLIKDEMIAELYHAMDKLPNKQRTVFILRYFQKLSHAEIARILDRDEGTIKANYHLALKKLQRAMKD